MNIIVSLHFCFHKNHVSVCVGKYVESEQAVTFYRITQVLPSLCHRGAFNETSRARLAIAAAHRESIPWLYTSFPLWRALFNVEHIKEMRHAVGGERTQREEFNITLR
jgi:hypothetical protein